MNEGMDEGKIEMGKEWSESRGNGSPGVVCVCVYGGGGKGVWT